MDFPVWSKPLTFPFLSFLCGDSRPRLSVERQLDPPLKEAESVADCVKERLFSAASG